MNGPIEDTNDPENPGGPGGRAISRRGEEARGGFVLRAKSDETPHRRRSLVERSGMKNFVQVNHFGIPIYYVYLHHKAKSSAFSIGKPKIVSAICFFRKEK